MVAATEVTYRRRAVDESPGKPRIGRTQTTAVDVVAAAATVLRPLVVAAAVIAVATVWSPRAHADVGDVLGDVGIGHNGAISSAIAEVGTSICPLLVQPGGELASSATQMSGHGGIAPPVAGFVTQMAIQSQCPAFMNALANGDIPALMNGGLPVSPPGLPALSLGAGTTALPALASAPPGLVPGASGALVPGLGLQPPGLGVPGAPVMAQPVNVGVPMPAY